MILAQGTPHDEMIHVTEAVERNPVFVGVLVAMICLTVILVCKYAIGPYFKRNRPIVVKKVVRVARRTRR